MCTSCAAYRQILTHVVSEKSRVFNLSLSLELCLTTLLISLYSHSVYIFQICVMYFLLCVDCTKRIRGLKSMRKWKQLAIAFLLRSLASIHWTRPLIGCFCDTSYFFFNMEQCNMLKCNITDIKASNI